MRGPPAASGECRSELPEERLRVALYGVWLNVLDAARGESAGNIVMLVRRG